MPVFCPLNRRYCLIWAALALLAGSLAAFGQDDGKMPVGEERVLDEPVKIAFRLESGSQVVQGVIEQWGPQGVSGSFGSHDWDALELSSLKRVFQRLMDRRSAEDWILMGELHLRRPEEIADRQAKIAFERAERLDPSSKQLIEAARARAMEVDRARMEMERMRAAEQLRQGLPEGVAWTAKPWPPLSDAEQAAAIVEMKSASDELLTKAGYPGVTPVETDYFLLYSDLSPRETATMARDLDAMYERVGEMLGLPPGLNLFWGKAAILICSSQDQFKLIEAQAFGQMIPNGVVGLCHCVGPRVFVNMFRAADDYRFAATLVHETVHGIMHRYLSPQRLPTWANEGFAEYVAAQAFRGSPVDSSRRPQALQFIRQGGSLHSIMEMSYQDGSWPGDNAIGYAVGYVMCDLMIREHPGGFADWVRAIKAGKPWRQALAEEFGADINRLATITRDWHMKND